LAGVILLLGWLYATADNPRSGAIFKKSIFLFALPIMFLPVGRLLAPLGMWGVVAWEEGLKSFASSREQNRVDRFWLVALFGIWELTLDKPFWGLLLAQPIANWGRLQVIGLVYATALPVLMHTVTAAIYAFAFEKRPWAAFIAAWAVHWTFNKAVDYFDLSVAAAVYETIVLGLILLGVLRAKQPLEETVG
jgi:hypothetical protein